MSEVHLKLYREAGRVGFFDVDPHLRLAPTALWRIFQTAAAEHARLLGAATEMLRERGQTWMLAKMRAVIDRPLAIGEAWAVETWPSTQLRGARALRDFVLKDAEGAVVARAASLWVIVDLETRRALRVPDEIVALRHDPGYSIPELSAAMEPDPLLDPEQPIAFRALWSDCDQNQHVNNVPFLRWAIDALPRPELEQGAFSDIEVHYHKEVAVDEVVHVRGRRCLAVAKSDGSLAATVRLELRQN